MSVQGYADWKPKPEAVFWVNRTLEVLRDYREYWPLTVRQLFYRLVADHNYEKTEAAYGRLTGMLARGRRAGMVPWEAIRDGGLGRVVGAQFFEDADHFDESVRSWAKSMKLDRQRDQAVVIELWCEAGGMVPILQGIAGPYSAQVNSGGGYDSVTAKHKLAGRVCGRAEEGLRTIILHVGDFDGSGEDMANVLRGDGGAMATTQVLRSALRDAWGPEWLKHNITEEGGLRAFRWAEEFCVVERVALTGEQVVERQVITAPPKGTDSRTAEFVRRNEWVAEELGTPHITAQLEALTPPELEEVIREAIEAHLDMDAYEAVLAEEAEVRAELLRRLDR